MINGVSKFFVLIFCIFLIFGCSGNKFKDSGMVNSFTFGLFGYDDIDCIRNYEPQWLKPYPNSKYPSRICTRYQHYTCHINHYCPNLPNQTERKKCEKDAGDYWIPNWTNAHGDPIKKAEISKKVCNSEASKNN